MIVLPWTALSTIGVLIVYFLTILGVGRVRIRYKVNPPATQHEAPEFNRAFRTQQNTLEQMMLFLPALWVFAISVGDRWAGLLGLAWVVGRLWYAVGYTKDGPKRMPGFVIGLTAAVVAIVGSLVAIIADIIAVYL
ncbi:MAG: MAPEG family protein [Pseudomonadota bacterium]